MDELALAVVLTGLPIAAWGGLTIRQARRSRARTAALDAWAKQHGFSYDARMEWEIPPELARFEAFSLGMGRAMENRIQGESSGLPVRIFDLRYGTSYGHHRWTLAHTIIEISSPRLNIPAFRIEPETVIHKMAEAMGAQDIDFESHPRFSDAYLLRGRSEEEIRTVFTSSVLDWFERHPGLSIEASGDRLLLHESKLLQPQQIEAGLALAREVHDLFA